MDIRIALPSDLRNEDEIIASWNGDITKPLVSIRCSAFNHVNYIEDAIKGFLIQETVFPIEIWIHDDASTDGTREVIEKYQSKYPRIIKAILQTENQFSKGNRPGRILMERCIGAYCAVCEGDDFWVDPLKLQKQAHVLERNPTVNMVIHPALKINAITGDYTVIGRYRSGSGPVPLADIITKRFGQIPTACTFIRRSVHDRIISFLDRNPYLTVGDIYLHIFGAENGWAFYLDDVCSVYRQFVEGSWTAKQLASPSFRMQHAVARIESFVALKDELARDSHEALEADIAQRVMALIKNPNCKIKHKFEYLRKYYTFFTLPNVGVALATCCVPNGLIKVAAHLKRRWVDRS